MTSGAAISVPFEYKYADLKITEATPNYAYVTITGGNKEGIYSAATTISGITGMTEISICSGTGFHNHYGCSAIITFFF